MLTGLSSTSTSIPSSLQRVTLSNEQCRSSNGIPMLDSHCAVAVAVWGRRWLVTWIQWPASCQSRTVSTAFS
jgi:hypothetical protein